VSLRSSGQASVETIGLVAVVAAMLSAAVALGPAPDVGGAVVRQMQRGLCVVRGGDCERDRAPCVVSSRGEASGGHGNLVVLRVGGGSALLIEQLSDGRVRVTRARESELGLEGGIGGGFSFDLGAAAIGVSAQARGAAIARMRSAITWERDSMEQAQLLVRRIASFSGLATELAKGRPLSMAASERGWSVRLSGSGSAAPAAEAELSLSAAKVSGARRLANGHRVVFVRESEAFSGALGIGPKRKVELAASGRDKVQVIAVEYDERDRPVDFAVTTVTDLGAASDLPEELRTSLPALLRGSGERILELERHLDLTVSANRDVAIAYLHAATASKIDFGLAAAAARRLGVALDAAGTAQARSYSLGGSDGGISGDFAAGVKIGGAYERSSSWSRLLGAVSRGPSGKWSGSGFCLGGSER
jgi:hypothetical protein